MPMGYHINSDEGLITVQADGEMDATMLTELGQSLLADERFDPTLPQLVDFRGLRLGAEPNLGRLSEFVQEHYRNQIDTTVAVVIDGHLEERHCADFYLITCAMDQAELFADYDQALRWLMRRAFANASVPLLSAEHEYAADDHGNHAPE